MGALKPPCCRLFGPPRSPLASPLSVCSSPNLVPLPYTSATSGPLRRDRQSLPRHKLNMSLLQGTADVSAIEAPVTIKAYLL